MEFLLPIIGGLLYWLIPNIGDTLFNTSDEGSQFKHKVTYNLPHEEKLIVEGEFVDGFLTTGGVVFRYESLWIDNDIRLEGFYDQTTSKLSNVSVVLKEQLLSYALPDDYSFIIYNDVAQRITGQTQEAKSSRLSKLAKSTNFLDQRKCQRSMTCELENNLLAMDSALYCTMAHTKLTFITGIALWTSPMHTATSMTGSGASTRRPHSTVA